MYNTCNICIIHVILNTYNKCILYFTEHSELLRLNEFLMRTKIDNVNIFKVFIINNLLLLYDLLDTPLL